MISDSPPRLYKTNLLMLFRAKSAVCSQTRTKHSAQGEHHVEFLNVNLGGTKINREALKG